MSTKLDVKVNQSIVSILGRKLYSSEFCMVIPREIIQNALDAHATKIDITWDSANYILTIADNGIGIEKIQGLLDTIGESIKDKDLSTIGGYGLAKLAIFGCKDWSFLSRSGKFSTGYIYDPENCYLSGTIVTCQFDSEDLGWRYEEQLKDYAKGINRDVEFTFNGELIKPYEYKTVNFGSTDELMAETRNNGYIVVRVNGLPTFNDWISGLKQTLFIDYSVTCTPYDREYPLTSNRDGFIQSSKEYKDLQTRIEIIRKKLETDRLLEENIKKQINVVHFRGKKYFSSGVITKDQFKENQTLLNTWIRYITAIADVDENTIWGCNFGLTDGADGEIASYAENNHIFFISVDVSNTDKPLILAAALHEYVHHKGYGRTGHDQSFANELTLITSKVLKALFSGEFRK